ncbi:hypothetical protein CC78DRAFT_608925 [Lojkania enalia]|uniref:Uncharacterized protein n=1 Tax=Lojkania enalia TaxID=147567 RepID=A0A9P4N963_9PLEO|nr:hypothetical protein CC78DRAFT_608925 [Didymosphaeria enalia]
MLLEACSLSSWLYSSLPCILGLVIYGTGLVLWIGMFDSGGYFNLVSFILKGSKKSIMSREGNSSATQGPSDNKSIRLSSNGA